MLDMSYNAKHNGRRCYNAKYYNASYKWLGLALK